ncbi:MAG: pentapeptide repeat-containing protein [Deltaproteobacteria bacterium]|nr:pentapeptide repeat-containing protein [Deltaproteobacteria bacterium]
MPTTDDILRDAKTGQLAGQDLSKANLKKADLAEAKLAGADLSRSRLTKAHLAGADLSGANLTRADLKGANLRGANLEKAILEKAALEGADLTDAKLSGAVFKGVYARKILLDRVTADGADFSGAVIAGAEGKQARFAGADFSAVDAVEVSFAETDFSDIKAALSVWQNSGLTQCDFSRLEGGEADFSLCAIEDSRFDGAKLAKADFSNTALSKTSFRSADLGDALFNVSEQSEVDFTDAELAGSNFKSVAGYPEDQIAAFGARGAKIDKFLARRAYRFVRARWWAQVGIVVLVVALMTATSAWFRNPQNWSFEKLDQSAQQARINNNLDQALAYYEIVKRKYAQNPIRYAHALNQLGTLRVDKGEYDPARGIFEDVIAKFPDQENAMIIAELGIADTYRGQKKIEKAVEMYQAFAEKWKEFPQAMDALDRIAKIYSESGRADKALEIYDAIATRYATDAGAILRAEFDAAKLEADRGTTPSPSNGSRPSWTVIPTNRRRRRAAWRASCKRTSASTKWTKRKRRWTSFAAGIRKRRKPPSTPK